MKDIGIKRYNYFESCLCDEFIDCLDILLRDFEQEAKKDNNVLFETMAIDELEKLVEHYSTNAKICDLVKEKMKQMYENYTKQILEVLEQKYSKAPGFALLMKTYTKKFAA